MSKHKTFIKPSYIADRTNKMVLGNNLFIYFLQMGKLVGGSTML